MFRKVFTLLLCVILLAGLAVPVAASSEGDGLKGEYYEGSNFRELKLTKIDPQIDFDWEAGAPADGMPADYFSIRWTGYLCPEESGTYEFSVLSNDGQKLVIDGNIVTDNWDTGITLLKGDKPLELESGKFYPITLEMFEGVKTSEIHLEWSLGSGDSEIIPQKCLYSEIPGDGQQEQSEGGEKAESAGKPTAEVVNVEWSSVDKLGNPGTNLIDGDMKTRWAGFGDGEHCIFELASEQKIGGVGVACAAANERIYKFDILVSNDKENWTEVFSGESSIMNDMEMEDFMFAPVSAKYVKLLGHENSVNAWNNYREVVIYKANPQTGDTSVLPIVLLAVAAALAGLIAIKKRNTAESN